MPTSLKLHRPAPARIEALALKALRRGLALLVLLGEAWIEARELQRIAHRRYPLADW